MAKQKTEKAAEEKADISVQEVEAEPKLPDEIQQIILKENGRCDKLSVEQKYDYANWICEMMQVKAALRPIDFIPTQGGIKPYLNKGAAEIIRDARGISVSEIKVEEVNGMFIVTCNLKDRNGRTDSDIGAWPKGDSEQHNSLMKAVTKAKRRATLSMCRLGGLVEEAHPTEYTTDISQQECKSQILLEDESSTKNQFFQVVRSKIGDEKLPREILADLCEQAKQLAFTQKIEYAAKWLQEKGRIELHVDDNGNVTKATIKEADNGTTKG